MKETFYNVNAPLKIALLADLHNHPCPQAIDCLHRQKPDIICIAGDMVDGHTLGGIEKQTHALTSLTECVNIAPTFMSLGNHEQVLTGSDFATIRDTGVVLLDNSWVEKDGLVLGGLSSGYMKNTIPDEDAAPLSTRLSKEKMASPENSVPSPDTAWLANFAKVDGYKILLCHHPEYISLIPPTVNLVLSGHAHGGQIRFFGHGLYAPDQGWFPKLTSGVHDGRLVISRGLSNPFHVPRIFNPYEVVYIN